MGFFKALLITLTEGSENYMRRHKELYPEQYSQQPTKDKEQSTDDSSEVDALMTLPESDILLPPDSEEF